MIRTDSEQGRIQGFLGHQSMKGVPTLLFGKPENPVKSKERFEGVHACGIFFTMQEEHTLLTDP